jgi:hypothetical protein
MDSGIDDKLIILRNLGPDGFSVVESKTTPSLPVVPIWEDFDGDQVADVAVVCHTANLVAFYKGEADGTVEPAGVAPVGSGPRGAVTLDANADGWLDLAIACRGADEIMVLLNYQGATGVTMDEPLVSSRPEVRAYPNPFNPQVVIGYKLQQAAVVNLEIINVTGRRVRSLRQGEIQFKGHHEVVWNGTDTLGRPVPSGIYFYRFAAGAFVVINEITLVR